MILTVLWYVSVVIGVLIGFILWYQKYSRFYKLLNKIPGHKGYPLLGTPLKYIRIPLDDLFDEAHKIVSSQYPIFKDWSFIFGLVHLQHPKDIEIVLSSGKLTDKGILYHFIRPWLGDGLLTSSTKKWHKRRKILTPAFHFKVLQEFVHTFNREADNFVNLLEETCCNPAVDIVEPVSQFTLKTISETSMGLQIDLKEKAGRDYKNAIHDFGKAFVFRAIRPWYYLDAPFFLSTAGRLTKSVVKVLHNFSMNVVQERKKNFTLPVTDANCNKRKLAMLDLLIKAQIDGEEIDDIDIREEVDTFMFEGHDTTASAICCCLFLLANHKEAQERIYQEIQEVLDDRTPTIEDFKQLSYMEMCIKESLRLYPSVHRVSRVALDDIKTATGYVIPKGCVIGVHIYDLHRDPRIYPDPEKFDPDRFLPENVQNRHPFAYIPFSAGQRNCIGQKFAMLEIKSLLCAVLRRFVLEPVVTPADFKVMLDLVIRSNEGFKIKMTHRS